MCDILIIYISLFLDKVLGIWYAWTEYYPNHSSTAQYYISRCKYHMIISILIVNIYYSFTLIVFNNLLRGKYYRQNDQWDVFVIGTETDLFNKIKMYQ